MKLQVYFFVDFAKAFDLIDYGLRLQKICVDYLTALLV